MVVAYKYVLPGKLTLNDLEQNSIFLVKNYDQFVPHIIKYGFEIKFTVSNSCETVHSNNYLQRTL